jgi:hypothetical protein
MKGFQVADEGHKAWGVTSLAMGILACAGVTAIWAVSTPEVDLPGWLRVISGWSFPVGALSAIGFGIAARVRQSGATLGTIGIALAAVSVIAFGVMIATTPY